MIKDELTTANCGILDHVPLGMCVIGPDFTVRFWNRCLEKWTGISYGEIVGTVILDHFPHFGEPHYFSTLESLFHGGPPVVFASQQHGILFPPRHAEQEPRVQVTTVTPIPDSDGYSFAALMVIEDVTELTSRIEAYKKMRDQARMEIEQRKQAERQLKAAKQEADSANEAKSVFLASMSHELRTPLNSMLLLSKHLADNRDGNLTQRQIESAETINKAGHDLLDLINDILDLSKVEAGKVEFEITAVDLREFTEDLGRTLRPLAVQKDLELKIEIAEDVPSSIISDGQRVHQIVKNLVANAIKFTETGSVTVGVERPVLSAEPPAGEASSQPLITISVTDTGIGIPPGKQHLIFEPFKQEDETTSRRYGGTGLGLSISRSLAEALGGSLSVTSTPQVGSTFTLTLPETAPEALGRAAEPAAVGQAAGPQTGRHDETTAGPVDDQTMILAQDQDETVSFANQKVLLVDDDMRNSFILTSMLEDLDVDVSVAANGAEGLERLYADPEIDLVLMDIMMPEMNGYEAMAEIRRRDEYRDLPVIAITALAMADDRERCLAAGATDYLAKPFEFSALCRLLRQRLPVGQR